MQFTQFSDPPLYRSLLFYMLLSLRLVEGTIVCHLSPDQHPSFHSRSQDQTQTFEHTKQALHLKPSFQALCSGFSNSWFVNLISWGCLDVPLWIGCFLMNFCCICTVGGRFLHGACHPGSMNKKDKETCEVCVWMFTYMVHRCVGVHTHAPVWICVRKPEDNVRCCSSGTVYFVAFFFFLF